MESIIQSKLLASINQLQIATGLFGRDIKFPAKRSSLITVILLVMSTSYMGAAHATIIPFSSLLEVEGRAFEGGSPIVSTVTQTQGATTNTLIAEDSNAITSGHATTNASATWLNTGQGNVNFSEVSLYLGPAETSSTVRNSGLFTYNFQADADGLMSVSYDIASTAAGLGESGYLNAKAFSIWLAGDDGGHSHIFLGQNTSGLFSASVVAGVDYQLMIRRDFISSSVLNQNNNLIMDATQSANFDWKIPTTSTISVPEPATIWLFGIGLLGIIRARHV